MRPINSDMLEAELMLQQQLTEHHHAGGTHVGTPSDPYFPGRSHLQTYFSSIPLYLVYLFISWLICLPKNNLL